MDVTGIPPPPWPLADLVVGTEIVPEFGWQDIVPALEDTQKAA